MDTLPSLLDTIYNLLPDFSGILLAAVGVALVVYPEILKGIEHRKMFRWAIATILVVLGIAGMCSSFGQHRDSDNKQSYLSNSVRELKATVDTFGPKLDSIISHPESEQQKELALALRREFDPKIQIDEPNNTVGNPILFNATITNVGGSVAKGKVDTVRAIMGPKGKEQENDLFRFLYAHEQDSDAKPIDVAPGYAHRMIVPILLPTFTGQEKQDFNQGRKVIYIGILETYFNEQGRQFHSEKCMYEIPASSLLIYCGSHNKIE